MRPDQHDVEFAGIETADEGGRRGDSRIDLDLGVALAHQRDELRKPGVGDQLAYAEADAPADRCPSVAACAQLRSQRDHALGGRATLPAFRSEADTASIAIEQPHIQLALQLLRTN